MLRGLEIQPCSRGGNEEHGIGRQYSITAEEPRTKPLGKPLGRDLGRVIVGLAPAGEPEAVK